MTEPTSVRLDKEDKEFLKTIAKSRFETLSDLLQSIIKKFIEEKKQFLHN